MRLRLRPVKPDARPASGVPPTRSLADPAQPPAGVRQGGQAPEEGAAGGDHGAAARLPHAGKKRNGPGSAAVPEAALLGAVAASMPAGCHPHLLAVSMVLHSLALFATLRAAWPLAATCTCLACKGWPEAPDAEPSTSFLSLWPSLPRQQLRWELGSPLFGLLLRHYAPDDTYMVYKVGTEFRGTPVPRGRCRLLLTLA